MYCFLGVYVTVLWRDIAQCILLYFGINMVKVSKSSCHALVKKKHIHEYGLRKTKTLIHEYGLRKKQNDDHALVKDNSDTCTDMVEVRTRSRTHALL